MVDQGNGEEALDQYEVWQKTNVDAELINAVISGHDQHGHTIYVARAEHNGILLPATFIPAISLACIAHNGLEIPKEDIEVLVDNNGYEWLGNDTPIGDFGNRLVCVGDWYVSECGHVSEIEEKLYIGRGSHEGNLRPGLWSLYDKCVLIPYGGEEIRVEDFEILVRKI